MKNLILLAKLQMLIVLSLTVLVSSIISGCGSDSSMPTPTPATTADAQAVAADKAALAITYISGDSAASVTGNLTLASTGPSGTTISWLSSNPSVISNAGAVTRPSGSDAAVTMTATISKGAASDTKVFTLTVKFTSTLTLTNTVTTIAGSANVSGSTDGTGSAARFNYPSGITTDGTSLYICDPNNSTIRKMVIATGNVTTIAGSPGVTGTTDGIGSAARFNQSYDITFDGIYLYVADTSNYAIRKVDPATGAVTTLAGLAGTSGTVDGTGTAARFRQPTGITTDGTNLYVADSANHEIRQIVIATGVVTTLAGSLTGGAADGTGAAASFHNPIKITRDGTNLYVTEFTNKLIRKIVISTGAVTTLAGVAGVNGSADGTGTAATFASPEGVTTDGTNLYVADTYNQTIRKIVISTGVVSTIAGMTGNNGFADGIGNAARFNFPEGITTDGTSLYVSDSSNNTIRKIQ